MDLVGHQRMWRSFHDATQQSDQAKSAVTCTYRTTDPRMKQLRTDICTPWCTSAAVLSFPTQQMRPHRARSQRRWAQGSLGRTTY